MPNASWRSDVLGDETRWMAVAIELIALVAVLVFALARSTT
jgi:hypothetical protein